jgi:hypothetical protein
LEGSHRPMELLEQILQKIGRDRFGVCSGNSSSGFCRRSGIV